jgi:hypothetical protein
MKRIAFAGTALVALAAVPALAQQGGEGRGRLAEPVTRAAVQQRVEARFAKADANHDGFVTRDEVRARAEAARVERQAHRGERRAQMFDRLDANHDGSISRAEFEAPPAFAQGQARGMGGERFAGRRPGARAGAMMARFGVRAFAMMDADRDGRVALAEAERAALQRFDRVDANRDGTISPDERQAARAAMRDRMRERR